MEFKYSIKDVLVYLLIGLLFFVLAIPIQSEIVINIIKFQSQYLGGDKLISSILAIAIFYFLGQIIGIIDLILRFHVANFLKNKSFFLFRLFYYLLAGTTVNKIIDELNINYNDFTEKSYILRIKDKHQYSEYYYVMHDLFNGLQVIISYYLIIIVLTCSIRYELFFGYLFLLFLFWIKARRSAARYIHAVNRSYDALIKNP